MANSMVVTFPVITAPAVVSRATTGASLPAPHARSSTRLFAGGRPLGCGDDVLHAEGDALERTPVDTLGQLAVGQRRAARACSSNRAR